LRETEVSHNHISPEKEKALEAPEAPVITPTQEIKEEVQDSPNKVLIYYIISFSGECSMFSICEMTNPKLS